MYRKLALVALALVALGFSAQNASAVSFRAPMTFGEDTGLEDVDLVTIHFWDFNGVPLADGAMAWTANSYWYYGSTPPNAWSYQVEAIPEVEFELRDGVIDNNPDPAPPAVIDWINVNWTAEMHLHIIE